MIVMHFVLILKMSSRLLDKNIILIILHQVPNLRRTRAKLIFNFQSLLTVVCISITYLGDLVLSNGGISVSLQLVLIFTKKKKKENLLAFTTFCRVFSSSDHFPCWEVFLLLFYHWKVNVILKCPLLQPRFSRGAYSFP